MMSVKEAVICWMPDTYIYEGDSMRGKAAVFPLSTGCYKPYSHTSGGVYTKVGKFTDEQCAFFVMSVALGMIFRDGLAPEVVHRALWNLKEYRDAIPEDVPNPTDYEERREINDL
jgi:hypothetical protein